MTIQKSKNLKPKERSNLPGTEGRLTQGYHQEALGTDKTALYDNVAVGI